MPATKMLELMDFSRFILTMWYVNSHMSNIETGKSTGFILTMWYVNFVK